jgi:peroxiredoxin
MVMIKKKTFVVDREGTIAELKLDKQIVFDHKHLYANESM